MIDHETHTVIDMIPMRDLEEVTQWLKTWKNLRLVTRDGSLTYRAAIRSAHPSCVQTADRFHLVKNVLEGADKTVRSILPRKVVLSGSTEAGDIPEKQAETELSTESECRRRDRAAQARKLRSAGMSYSQIGKYLGLDRKTVRKYCDEDFSPRFRSGRKRSGKLDAFRARAAQLFHEGKRVTEIFEILKKVGYEGSYPTVQKYIKTLKEANPTFRAVKAPVRAVDRSCLVSLVYKPVAQIPELTTEELEEVLDRFPALWEVYECIDEFRRALFFGTQQQLAQWIARTADSRFPKLVTAAEGLRRDLDAVMNAVIQPYSNGVVEGSNTKIKLAKRIMYGRCHFSTLRTKILLKEQRRVADRMRGSKRSDRSA